MSTADSYNFARQQALMIADRELELVKHCCCYLGHSDRVEELQAHYVYRDASKHLKAMKDENAPKRARSSYMLFSNHIRAEVMKENPTLEMGQVSKILGTRWHDATDTVKEEFRQLAEQDKERYTKEMDIYTKKLHEQSGGLSGVGSSNSSAN